MLAHLKMSWLELTGKEDKLGHVHRQMGVHKDAQSRGCRICRYKPGKQHIVLKKHSVVEKASTSEKQDNANCCNQQRWENSERHRSNQQEERESVPAIAKKVTQEGTQLNIERIANALYSRDNPINMKVCFRRFYMKVRQTAD